MFAPSSPRTRRLPAPIAALLPLFALFALFVSTPAPAQTADVHVRAVFDAFEPPAPGLTLAIRNAPPAPPEFAVQNDSDKELELTGYDFEPFVRVGRKGVFANRRSRTFYVTQDPTGSGKAPSDARPGAVPVWTRVGAEPRWRWYEGRAAWRQPVPAAIASANRLATLGPWTLPAKLDGKSLAIKGHMVWKPILGEIRARLVGVEPPVTGLEVRVLQGPVPGVVVTSTGVGTVEIESRDGAAFARISQRGVDVNLDSATARDNPRFSSSGGRGWTHVQDTRVLSWLERRAAYAGEGPPGDERKPAELLRWNVPLRLDQSQRARIVGVTEWTPFATTSGGDGSRSPKLWIAALLAVVFLVVIAFAVVSRSRSRGKQRA